MIARACFALAAALAVASCGTPLMTLPAGPGVPAPDGAAALLQAMATCQGVQSLSAELSVSGTIGGHRSRGRLLLGLAAPASAYLDAPAPFGPSAFIFAAVGDDATLLLPRDRRVLQHERSSDVLEAVTGVPLGPADLRVALTGCAPDPIGHEASRVGDGWLRISGSTDIYLREERRGGPWRVVAILHHDLGRPAWRAEYADFSGNLPRTVRFVSADPDRFSLRLVLSQVDVNVPLEGDTFRPSVPREYTPITMGEVRAAGPLSGSGGPDHD